MRWYDQAIGDMMWCVQWWKKIETFLFYADDLVTTNGSEDKKSSILQAHIQIY